MDIKREIMELSALHYVSGGEGEFPSLLADRLRPLVDSVHVDRFGNVTGYRSSGRVGAPRLMLDAHIDQVGLMVTEVTDDGFARFTSIAVDTRVLLANVMVVLGRNGPVKGVVSVLPPHLQNEGDDQKPVPIAEMILDLGMSGKQAKALVRPGDLVVYDTEPIELLNNTIAGAALDNRAGFASVLYALELLREVTLPCDLVVAGTTREESGFYGAVQCVERERPDYIVVVDACHARTDDTQPYERVHELGAGPVIGRGANSAPRLAERLIRAAHAERLSYQLEAIPKTSFTDAWAVQIAAQGAVTAVVSLPVRYMHTPVETLCVEDALTLGKLLCAFCRSFEGLDTEGEKAI